jgi:hypothetical protein
VYYRARPIQVFASPYKKGLEDGFRTKSVGEKGKPWVKTIRGDAFIFEGDEKKAPDWVIVYPDNTKDVVPDKIFGTRFENWKKAEKRNDR